MKNNLLEIVPEYRSRFSIVRNLFISRVVKSLNVAEIRSGFKVLDAGCGEGMLMKIASSKSGVNVFGFDHNPLVKNLNIPGAKITCADLTKTLPYFDKSFDRIFCLDTLEHLKKVDKSLLEFKRIMKKNALLIVSGPTENLFYKFCRFILKGTFSEKAGPSSSPHFHDIDSLKGAIEKRGFKCLKTVRIPMFPIPTLFKILVFRKDD